MSYYAPGQYKATITHVGLSKSSKKSTEYVQIIVEPTAIVDVAANATYPVEKTYERELSLWLTEATADRTVEDLRRIGFEGDSFEELVDGPAHDSLIGVEIQVVCEHEQSPEGRVFERWRLSGSAGPPRNPPLDKAAARKLNAMFGRQLKASKVQAANTPGPAKPARVDAAKVASDINKELAAVRDDDAEIPF